MRRSPHQLISGRDRTRTKVPRMGHLLSRGDFHSFPLFLFSNSFVRPPAEPFFRPGRSFRAPARAAAVKDGPALRATALAARSVLDGREHDGRMRRLGSDPLRIAGSQFPQSGRRRAVGAPSQRADLGFDVTCDAAIVADKIRGELAIEVGALIARHGLVFGRSFGDRTMMQSCASAARLRGGGVHSHARLEGQGALSDHPPPRMSSADSYTGPPNCCAVV
jgi:hypothetical protein